MAKSAYIGDTTGIAKKIKKMYVGDANGVARKVKKAYVGDANGVARLFYRGGHGYEGLICIPRGSTDIYNGESIKQLTKIATAPATPYVDAGLAQGALLVYWNEKFWIGCRNGLYYSPDLTTWTLHPYSGAQTYGVANLLVTPSALFGCTTQASLFKINLDNTSLQYIGSINGGSCTSCYTDGAYAYFANSKRIYAIDLADSDRTTQPSRAYEWSYSSNCRMAYKPNNYGLGLLTGDSTQIMVKILNGTATQLTFPYSAPLGSNGTGFFYHKNDIFYASATGDVKQVVYSSNGSGWSSVTPPVAFSSPTIIDDGEKVYALSRSYDNIYYIIGTTFTLFDSTTSDRRARMTGANLYLTDE